MKCRIAASPALLVAGIPMRVLAPLLVLSFALLSGCVSLTPEERRAADERTCRSYGFKVRTNAFAECLQRIDLARDADRRARLYGDAFYGPGFGIGRFGPYW